MIDFFDTIHSKVQNEKGLIKKIRLYSIIRLLILIIANITLPVYFTLTRNNKNFQIRSSNEGEECKARIIVSLTSFPARINSVWIVIESIMRQKVKPDMILLWLSKKQFETIDKLPKRLLKLKDRGLDIRLVDDDFKSHKKYYYVFKMYPEDSIITFDDDIIYSSRVIEELIFLHKKYPEAICCTRAWKIEIEDNNNICEYVNWTLVKKSVQPTHAIMPTYGAGALFPPQSLSPDVLCIDRALLLCPNADDIWLNVMSRLQGTKSAKTEFSSYLLQVIDWKNRNVHLYITNVLGGENDKQLLALRNYYITNKNIDPYEQILTK